MNTRKTFDAIAIVLGLWLIVSSPFLLTAQRGLAMWSVLILGVVIVVFAMWGETEPKNPAPELMNVLIGVLLFLLPWITSFTDVPNAAWNAWVVGVILVALEATAIPGYSKGWTSHHPG